MTKVRTWAGLDVHAASTVACVVDALSGELSVRRLSCTCHNVWRAQPAYDLSKGAESPVELVRRLSRFRELPSQST